MTEKEIIQALRCGEDANGTPRPEPSDGEIVCYDPLKLAAADLIERLTAENAVLREKVPQWIRCKDELPQPEQAILTRDKWGHIRDRVFHKFLSGPVLFRPDGLAPIKDVTHWMPLPEAPAEGEKEDA
jgi:hypothetical protein|nr:MAG TPA: Protein of unknown function (DUF551) [Caudoviricetes sp.]